jgi:Toprim domain
VNLQTLACALGGTVNGNRILAPGPSHSRHDRSLAIWIDPSAPDGFRLHSFAGDDWRECRDYVRDHLRLPREHEQRWAKAEQPARHNSDDDLGKFKREKEWETWERARRLPVHPASSYLRSRGLDLDDDVVAADALRCDPACPLLIEGVLTHRPAVIAKLVDVHSNEFRGIQRIYLKPDGTGKANDIPGGPRRMLGASDGAVCKLVADENVDIVLGVGEGVESVLSMRHIEEFGAAPVWACCSSGRLEGFPVLNGVETLWVAVDRDDAGQRATKAVVDRWTNAGREVFTIVPHALQADINDIVRSGING